MDANSGLTFANALFRQRHLIPVKYRVEIICLVFSATKVRDSKGDYRAACLVGRNGSWTREWGWFDGEFCSNCRLVRFRKWSPKV
jgi:hypothetical protein